MGHIKEKPNSIKARHAKPWSKDRAVYDCQPRRGGLKFLIFTLAVRKRKEQA